VLIDGCVNVLLCVLIRTFVLIGGGWVMEGILDGILFIVVFLVSVATAHVYLQCTEVCGCTGSLVKWSCVL
jgi:hypothetical protein